MNTLFKYLPAAILASCASAPVPAATLPSYFLVAIDTTNPAQPPRMLSPHFTNHECENARKDVVEKLDIPKEIEVVCLKIIKGIQV
jgi:hypothetical protein